MRFELRALRLGVVLRCGGGGGVVRMGWAEPGDSGLFVCGIAQEPNSVLLVASEELGWR